MRHSAALLALSVLLCALSVLAERVAPDDALLAGRRFLDLRIARDGGWGDRASAHVLGAETLERGGRLLGYWLPVEPRGHIIVSSLRALPAIKAWRSDSDFEPLEPGYPELIHGVFALTLDFLEDRYGDLDRLPLEADPDGNREGWDGLLGGAPGPRDLRSVGPLLSSSWHQGGPYNADCPPGDGGTCVVGCVATAAAQILAYWKYPEAGEGSSSYYWGGDDSCGGSTSGAVLSAQYSDPYDWENILGSYGGGYAPEQAAAVAELCYEMGVAFEMDYGVCASGAYLNVGVDVYPGHFRYSDEIDYLRRSEHSQAEWWELIRGELDAVPPRPISYGIHSHAIVCDGYSEDGGLYYHMNYGWGGGSNAWYALDATYCPWSGCDYLVENMTLGIEPIGYFSVLAPDDGDLWEHGDALPEIAWSGCEGGTLLADLYRGADRVARLFEGAANDGTETPPGAVSEQWGTGEDFRVKVVDEEGRFGWSGEFSIFAPAQWADATAGPLGDDGAGRAAAWGDFDGDGLDDLHVTRAGESNLLYRNLGDGGFADASADPIDLIGHSQGAFWADIDNDDDLDLFVTLTNGEGNRLFRNDGGSFSDISTPELAGSAYSSGAAWGDYDADGLLDLYIVNVYAADKLFRNEGGGAFSDATAAPMGDAGFGRSAVWVDYDADGDQDLYLVRSTANRMYRNEGGSGFTRISTGALAEGGDGYACAWGDYNNDGDLDLYLANQSSNTLLRNDGGGAFSDATAAPLDDTGASRWAGWADCDNDGRLDLFVANDGGNHLYRNLGDGFVETTDALLGDASNTVGCAFSDYDLDGRVDLYMVNSNAPDRLVRNQNESGHHWIQVDLLGGDSNRGGVGASIRLSAGGVTLQRQAGVEAGYLSQGSLRSEFGLGTAETVDSLRVLWPSGRESLLLGPAVDQIIEIAEPDGPTGMDEQSPAPITLLGAYPNPFNPRTEIIFEMAVGAEISLDVFDVGGRHIRNLACGYWPVGSHRISWSGENEEGEAQGSGLYFLRLSDGRSRGERKMLLLK